MSAFQPDADTLLFFSGHASALPTYVRLEKELFRRFPKAGKRVQKTQITFFQKHVFACVSFQRLKKKAELPEGWLVLTLGLASPLASGRVAVQTEPYPGRWTAHFVLESPAEVDGELLAWVEEAHAFAQGK